jgi:hypothetical protein
VLNRATTIQVNAPARWKTLWTNNTEADEVNVVTTTNDHDHFAGWIFTR